VGRAFFKLADLTAVYFPHATTAVSLVQKNYYEKKFTRNVHYIPTGVNHVNHREPQWILSHGLEPNQYILFAARLVEEKGAHFLIDAFRSIDTDMKLVVAGDAAHADGYKSSLRKMAQGDNRVVFPGFVSGPPLEELFSNAYLFCLPSTLEGLPIALLEAMSYGNCCVASDIPENLEAIKNFGYTFKNRDPGDLKQVLEDLVKHPEKTQMMKKIARQYVLENYSWDRIADQMEALYLSLV
jgi:glycosyltransferase involved in cell wall biosynthesis